MPVASFLRRAAKSGTVAKGNGRRAISMRGCEKIAQDLNIPRRAETDAPYKGYCKISQTEHTVDPHYLHQKNPRTCFEDSAVGFFVVLQHCCLTRTIL